MPPSSRISACSSVSAERFLATTSRPEVSRSSRCTSSSVSFGRSARRVSIAPKLMPLPPWLATPDGLFSASRRASSNTMLASSASRKPCGGVPLSPGSLEPDRRNPDLVAGLELALGLRPAAVDPHLAGAHQLVDQAARRALELAQQEVVEALAVAVFGDAHGAGAPAPGVPG